MLIVLSLTAQVGYSLFNAVRIPDWSAKVFGLLAGATSNGLAARAIVTGSWPMMAAAATIGGIAQTAWAYSILTEARGKFGSPRGYIDVLCSAVRSCVFFYIGRTDSIPVSEYPTLPQTVV
jgi:hypothetical protein